MLTDNSGNPRQTRQIFQRSCLYYSDLSNFFPHFGSVGLILNIPWNKLYIWLYIYSIWSKMASKSLTKYTLTWKERGENSSKKWLLLPKFEFSFSGCHNLTNTPGKQEAGIFYALGVSVSYSFGFKLNHVAKMIDFRNTLTTIMVLLVCFQYIAVSFCHLQGKKWSQKTRWLSFTRTLKTRQGEPFPVSAVL